MPDHPRPKIVMIGMDAAELSFIQQRLPALPALRRIFETGTLHHLASTAGVFPGSVWPTFYSGMLPGEHGIYHHLQWDPDAMQLRRVADDWLFVEPFWYQLERRGLRVAAIDVPMSFPPRLARGAEIINWGSHDELGPFRAHPRPLAGEIRRRFGRHPMGSEIPVRKTPDQLARVGRDLVAGARRKSELSRWMLAQADWDFFLTVFGETHRGGHLLWSDVGSHNGLLEVYRAVDQGIGEMLDALPQGVTTIILFALHGMGPNTSQEHFMPKLMDRANQEFLGSTSASKDERVRAPGAGQRSPMRVLRERLPPGLQHAIAGAVPVAIRDFVVNQQISSGHDWSRTPGIALLADLNGYLRWNIRGRERRGMLDPQSPELQHYLSWLGQTLMAFKVPGPDVPLVRDVLVTRDHFPGRRTNFLPDAVVTWTGLPSASRIDGEGIGPITADPATGRAGNHRPEGFCVILERGPAQEHAVPPPRHIGELGRFVPALLDAAPPPA